MQNMQEKHTTHTTILSENPRAGHHFENVGTDGMTILKYIFENKVYMCGLNPTG
jgi:hypothetical protein